MVMYEESEQKCEIDEEVLINLTKNVDYNSLSKEDKEFYEVILENNIKRIQSSKATMKQYKEYLIKMYEIIILYIAKTRQEKIWCQDYINFIKKKV